MTTSLSIEFELALLAFSAKNFFDKLKIKLPNENEMYTYTHIVATQQKKDRKE